MKKKLIALLIIALAAGAVLLYPPAPSKEENTLVVGTNAEYPPFTYMENSQIIGFDIDVIKEVGKRLGKKIKISDLPFDALIPALHMQRVDCIAAGITATEERAKRILFSKPYVTEDPLVIVSLPNKPINKVENLVGMRVVVNEGYTADIYLSQMEGVELLRLPSPADAFAALSSGQAGAFVTAKSSLGNANDKNWHTALTDAANDGVSIACGLKNPELLEEIDQALQEMKDDGTLGEFKNKWNVR